MGKVFFSNNGVALLAGPIRAEPDWDTHPDDEEAANVGYTSFSVTSLEDAETFAELYMESIGRNDYQPLTLTHENLPDEYEIVHLLGREGTSLLVERAQENTNAKAWPAGTKLSANVTRGMLEKLLQDDGSVAAMKGSILAVGQERQRNDSDYAHGYGSILLKARSPHQEVQQIAGYPLLHAFAAMRPSYSMYDSFDHDLGMSHEAAGLTNALDLGVPDVWTSGYRQQAQVVVPTVPNGFQYWMNIAYEYTGEGFWEETEHEGFANNPGEKQFIVDNQTEDDVGDVRGIWMPQAMPLNVRRIFRYPLMVTELGFYGFKGENTTSDPVISIGTDSDPTRYANNVALTGITESEYGSVFRIPVPNGGELTQELVFKVDTAAAGGTFKGFFYWRGLFFKG